MELSYTHVWKGVRLTTGHAIEVEANGDVLLGYTPYEYAPPVPVDRFELYGTFLGLVETLYVNVPQDPVYTRDMDVDGEGNIVLYTDGDGTPTPTAISNTGAPVSRHEITEPPYTAYIAVDGDDNVWMAAEGDVAALIDNDDGGRIMDVDNDDLAPAKLIWGGRHGGIAVDENGWVYVVSGRQVIRFDPCDVGSTAEVAFDGTTDPDTPCSYNP